MINVNDNTILNPENVVIAEQKGSMYKLTLINGKTLYVNKDVYEDIIISEPISKEYVDSRLDQQDAKLEQQDTQINNLIGGEPRYVNTSSNILALTTNKGVAVGTDDGHWYYWDGTQYVDSGYPYQATQVDYKEYRNLINYNDCFKGYYAAGGSIYTGDGYISYIIPVNIGDTIYFNIDNPYVFSALLNSNKEYIQNSLIQTKAYTIPNVTGVAYISIPILINNIDKIFISDVNLPSNTILNNSSVIFGAFTGRYDIDKLYDYIRNCNTTDSDFVVNYRKHINSVGIALSSFSTPSEWKMLKFNTNYLRCITFDGFILLAYNDTYLIGIYMQTGQLYTFNRNSITSTIIHNFNLSNYCGYLLNYYIDNKGNVLITKENDTILSFNLSDYITIDSYTLTLGWCFTNAGYYQKTYDFINVFDVNINSDIKVDNSIVDNYWSGKVWHSFGTSISNISNEGKYPTYLASLSGLTLVNKAVSGGRISNQILDAIYNDSDIANADLITIEGFVNDWYQGTPLGTITDTTENTFYGYLYRAITYILANSNATLVIITDYTGRNYNSINVSRENVINGNTQRDFIDATIKMCKYMNIPVIDAGSKSLISQDTASLYLVDQIHNNEKGGQQFANTIWSELKNIKPRVIYEDIMANNKHTTLMEVCVNPKLKQTAYKPLDDCIIGYDDKGKEIKVSDLLAFYYD